MRDDHPESPQGAAVPRRPGSRRSFLRTGSFTVTAAALGTAGASAALTAPASAVPMTAVESARLAGRPIALTPACDGHETPAAMEGPLFKPESPERTDLVTPGVTGVGLELTGTVYDTTCRPLPGTLIEFWQCDQNGDYDTIGFSLRGHQYTNGRGAFRLRTIVPRDYTGRWGTRAPHIHTQVQTPGGPVLITQLYFPDDTRAYGRDFARLNASDGLINRACTIALTRTTEGSYNGAFDFVVKTTAP
ncbi:dioxygenase family protein [Streptomyces yaizuensis]|uniref:Dioxygenase n=1 Tax=Streptomyces yaizuensis TaxID=2989713 RepID=A0ABQ5NUH8_9ACTN|nr:dioxygenase [Streptomyces sp. YSPA8]GLF93803.1 dioxygenase [Streptomyces sp. YSPA8]